MKIDYNEKQYFIFSENKVSYIRFTFLKEKKRLEINQYYLPNILDVKLLRDSLYTLNSSENVIQGLSNLVLRIIKCKDFDEQLVTYCDDNIKDNFFIPSVILIGHVINLKKNQISCDVIVENRNYIGYNEFIKLLEYWIDYPHSTEK